jgi:hypothetical protein
MDKIDAEINAILLYIAEEIDGLGDDINKGEFAKRLGLTSSKNFNDFLKYAQEIKDDNKIPEPKFRTVYRLLRGFLKRPPIDINKFEGEETHTFNKFMEIIFESKIVDEGKSYEAIKGMINFTHYNFMEIKKQVCKKRG